MFTRLEDLPNELLLDLFDYTDIRDLYTGFSTLNLRFYQLLVRLKQISLIVERDESQLISIFAEQITCLIVKQWQDIDFCRLPRLHTVILYQATSTQIRQILSNCLPHLVYLSTCYTPELDLLSYFAQKIFSNVLPSIRHVRLGHVYAPYSLSWLQSPNLVSVSIDASDPTLIGFLLASAPHLVYLRIRFTIDTIPVFYRSPSINTHPLKQFRLYDPYHKLSFNHIFTILTWMSNLQRIYLNFLCKIPMMRCARHLVSRLPMLTRFDCHIDDASHDRTLTSIEAIRLIHPCFSRLRCTIDDVNFRTLITE
jgi:hypothetical protein